MTTAVKEANLLPSTDQVAYAAEQYAPAGIATGAAAAGLVNLLAELRRNRESQATLRKNDVLEVPIPVKQAAIPSVGEIGALIGRGANAAKDEFVKHPIRNTSAAGLLAGGGYLGLKSSVPALQGRGGTPPPSYLWEAPLDFAAGAGSAAATYAGVNALINHVRAKREQKRLDAAKAEYGQLLGNELAGPDDVKVAAFPLCEDTVRFMAGVMCSEFGIPVNSVTKLASTDAEHALAMGTSVPTFVALLAAVAAHKYMYDREEETIQGARLAPKKVQPPKQIRLVSTPAPTPGAPEEDPNKLAMEYNPATAAAADIAMGTFLINKAKESKEKQETIDPNTGLPVQHPIHAEAKQNFVDGNTMVVNTPTGSVMIDAADPRALEILKKKHDTLAQNMQAASVIPTGA